MRERSLGLIVWILLGGLVVVGGVYLYQNHLLPSLAYKVSPQQDPPKPPPAIAKPQTSSAKPKRRGVRPTPPAEGLQRQEPTIAFAAAAAPPRVRPRASEIPINMSMSDLVGKFGDPDVMVSWSNEGKLNRRLVYANDAASVEVTIQNGRVVSTRE